MRSFFFFVFLCLVTVITGPDCSAQVSTSLDLLNNAKEYDGKTVYYKGEVIGDVMIRGDHAWLHVNDGTIAIGIWASNTLVNDISYAGDYQNKGDIVEVHGTFNRSCSEHGGDLDIHASKIKKITQGSPVIQPINIKKARIGAYLSILVILFIALIKFFKNRWL